MKTLAISDLHGKSFSTVFYQHTSLYYGINNIVQLGDWFDSEVSYYTSNFQIGNFKQMMKIKSKNPNIHLLIGNHDASYILGGEALYNGRCRGHEEEIRDLILDNIHNIDYFYDDGNYIYSHAGISQTLLDELKIKDLNELNDRLHNKDFSIFTDSKVGLLWKRFHKEEDLNNPNMTWNDLLKNRIDRKQVIGHFASLGMQILDKIYSIEDYRHANCVLFT